MTKPALIPPSRGLNIKLSIWAAAWFGIVLAVLLHLFNDSVTSVLYQFSPIVEAFDIVLPPKGNVIKEAKPPHCRPDLPGCVPRVVENIFFLHVPKTAGTSALYFLWANSQQHPVSYTFTQCDARNLGFERYSCSARRGWSKNISEFARSCRDQADALQSSEWEDPFSTFGCSTISGHYDMTAFHRMHPKVKEKTLVVVSMREPRDLIVSLFHFLPLQRQACTHLEDSDPQCSFAVKHWDSCTDLNTFLGNENGLGLDLRGGVTKLLAGDYCCWNDKPPLIDPKQRLQAALYELENTVGVVLLKERMAESLQYLGFVLGWPTDVDTNVVVNANPNSSNLYSLPSRTKKELSRIALEDRVIYLHAKRRLNEQVQGMEKAKASLS